MLVSVWIALARANWSVLWPEAVIAAIMLALLGAYYLAVTQRRRLAASLRRRTGIAAFTVDAAFRRDLGMPQLEPIVWRIGRPILLISLAIFIASGFWEFA